AAPGQVPRVPRIPGQHRLGVGRRHDAAYRGTARAPAEPSRAPNAAARGHPRPAERSGPGVTSPLRPAGLRARAIHSLHTLRMDRNAYRDDNDTGQPDAYQPDAYWRRRVITLCAGLTLLGLLAWAFSGGGGKPAAKKGSQASGALPAAAYSGTPTPGADTSPGANASASAGSSASLPFLTASPSPGASTAGASTAGASTAGLSASASAKAAR